MRGLDLSLDSSEAYDNIYLQSWHDALAECEKKLERQDHQRALQIKTLQDFRNELNHLLEQCSEERSRRAVLLLYPTLDDFETFAQNFVRMMLRPVDTSMMWGLLFLVLKLALLDQGPVGPLQYITRWLEKIGHRLRDSNDCNKNINDFMKVKGDTVEVNKEIMTLWINIIMMFRNQDQGLEAGLDEYSWKSLTVLYTSTYRNIEDAVKRIEKVATMAEKNARAIQEMTLFQRLLSLEQSSQDGASLPCNTLPVAENQRFFGRRDVLAQIDDHLKPTDTASRLASVALYGLGGIGKTQTALAYAYQKLSSLDAVFWISAEDQHSIQQYFSRVATDALKLRKAKPQAYTENMILVLDWLQKTSIYMKHGQQLHTKRKSGWKYLGYEHSLDTVWDMSFRNLGIEARACLGVLSFLSADSIPSEIFLSSKPDRLPELLSFCADELELDEAIESLTHHALVRKNIEKGTFRVHRLVQAEFRLRTENKQEHFEAAIQLLLEKFPSQREKNFGNKFWILYEKYLPQVLALVKNYNSSQGKPDPLRPTKSFVILLTNSANSIDDNDTLRIAPELVETADAAYRNCPEEDKDRLLWAFLLTLKAIHHSNTSEFSSSELERRECLEIRQKMLPPNDLLVALAYNGVGLALGCQDRFEEAEQQFVKSGEIFDGPAGEVVSRRLQWKYNMARNNYCMGKYGEAEIRLEEGLALAKELQGWYMIAYGHLAFASLYTRTERLHHASEHVDCAEQLIQTSGAAARFSWLGSYCAYRAGDIALRQGLSERAM
ncbi:unnamed protein product [Clonostachys solani]|uniref:DUF7779 domain-containing protein n=1 Tax=Clonostachys solani TaxID=160281 RepID=A0A9N9ZI80_9HYPO|nr:unnamed protein product [Clonostachys solani]